MKNFTTSLQILMLAIFVACVFFVWQGNVGFSLWDEGYFWYGVQHVMLGEVPIRDFMAYDPGRYYWSAAFMSLWGDNGIMALRFTSVILETVGIFIALLLIAGNEKKRSFFYLTLSAITLLVWMMMGFKAADYVASIALIGALAFLVKNQTTISYFAAGLCIGISAFLGRNHGVYGVMGSLGVMLYLNIKRSEGLNIFMGLCYWAMGIALGYVPMVIMILAIPGYASAFWESILFLFEVNTTNLPLPLPWPWLVSFATLPFGEAVRGVLVGVFFIAIVVFGVLSIAWVFWCKFQGKNVSPVLVASAFLALPYAHYAYSRADVAHLSLGIFPLLIGCLAVLASQPDKIKWPLSVGLSVSCLWVMIAQYPGWQCYIDRQCTQIEISGNNIVLDQATATDVALLRQLASKYAPDGQSFITVPFWPGSYPLLGRISPTWELYPLLPRSETFQQAEIERIKKAKPTFAVVYDYPLDGREELRYQNTHRLIYRYIQEHFDRVPNSPNPAYQIYMVKGNGQ